MSDLRQAAHQALEALESLQGGCTDSNDGTVEAITVWCPEVIDALRAALAQPESVQHCEIERLRAERDALLALIASDTFAASFQSLGQYRSALLKGTGGSNG